MDKYIYIICPFVTLVICQIIKFIIEAIENKKMNFARLINGCGGMPSSHTSFSSSVTMLIGFEMGFDTPLFAACLIFTFITAYDPMGLRWESGKQAEAINLIFDSFVRGKPKKGFKRLKEQLGHKPLEVIAGMLLGTIVALIFSTNI